MGGTSSFFGLSDLHADNLFDIDWVSSESVCLCAYKSGSDIRLLSVANSGQTVTPAPLTVTTTSPTSFVSVIASSEGAKAVVLYGANDGGAAEYFTVTVSGGSAKDADNVDDNGSDITSTVASGGAGNVSIFEADNEYLIVGDAARFKSITVTLGTVSSTDIAATFEYSTGVGTWASFTPTDFTSGFTASGQIAWTLGSIPSWAVGTGSEFLIRITRTENTITTTPILDEVQITDVGAWSASSTSTVTSDDLAAVQGTAAFLRTSAGSGNELQFFFEVAGSTDRDNIVYTVSSAGGASTVFCRHSVITGHAFRKVALTATSDTEYCLPVGHATALQAATDRDWETMLSGSVDPATSKKN